MMSSKENINNFDVLTRNKWTGNASKNSCAMKKEQPRREIPASLWNGIVTKLS